MDNLTHSLIGLTLAQTPLRRAGRGTTLTLLLASNAPDSDIVAAFGRGGAAYLSAHRGSSHGPLGVIGLAFLAAALVYVGLRGNGIGGLLAPDGNRPKDSRPLFFPLAGVAVIGTLAHVLMDLPTSYGTRSLSPFDRTWYTLDWMPIIDGYLLAVLAAGLAMVRWKPYARTRIATTVLLLVVANYVVRAELHAIALRQATGDDVDTVSLSAWPDAVSPKLPSDYPCIHYPCGLATAALPTFGSPFRWRIVRQFSDGYQFTDTNLLTRTQQSLGSMGHDSGPTVEAARAAADATALLAFSRFPAARVVESNGDTIVQIRDVRFLNVAITQRGEEFRPRGLFVVTVRLDRHGTILDSRFGN